MIRAPESADWDCNRRNLATQEFRTVCEVLGRIGVVRTGSAKTARGARNS